MSDYPIRGLRRADCQGCPRRINSINGEFVDGKFLCQFCRAKKGEFPAESSSDPATSGVGTARANDQRLVKGGGSHGE